MTIDSLKTEQVEDPFNLKNSPLFTVTLELKPTKSTSDKDKTN